jgi:EthD domain-containing protein
MPTREYEKPAKLIELVRKRADISDDLFHYHWHGIHGPLARGVAGLERYIQHHRIEESVEGLPPLPYEGVVEAWFEDAAVMAALPEDRHYAEHVSPHEPIQIELRELRNLVARSRVYLEPQQIGPAAVSIVLLIARRPDLTREAFGTLWRAHAEVALTMPRLERYVQSDVVEGGDPDKSGFAAAAFLGFADIFALEEAWASPAGRQALVADLARFALPSACAAHVSHMRPVIWP